MFTNDNSVTGFAHFSGEANWKAFVTPSICFAVIMVGIFSVRYFRQK
jgi:hypothetical protein